MNRCTDRPCRPLRPERSPGSEPPAPSHSSDSTPSAVPHHPHTPSHNHAAVGPGHRHVQHHRRNSRRRHTTLTGHLQRPPSQTEQPRPAATPTPVRVSNNRDGANEPKVPGAAVGYAASRSSRQHPPPDPSTRMNRCTDRHLAVRSDRSDHQVRNHLPRHDSSDSTPSAAPHHPDTPSHNHQPSDPVTVTFKTTADTLRRRHTTLTGDRATTTVPTGANRAPPQHPPHSAYPTTETAPTNRKSPELGSRSPVR